METGNMCRFVRIVALATACAASMPDASAWCQTTPAGIRISASLRHPQPAGMLIADSRRLSHRDLVRAATAVKDAIESDDESGILAASAFAKRIEPIRLRRLDAGNVTVADARRRLAEIQRVTELLLRPHAAYDTKLDHLAKSLAAAPATYEALANSFAQKATSDARGDIAGVHHDCATISRNTAKKYRQQHRALTKHRSRLDDALRPVRHGVEILRELQPLLDVLPSTADAEMIAPVVLRLNECLERCDNAIEAVRALPENQRSAAHTRLTDALR
jgi:hypothetical protein